MIPEFFQAVSTETKIQAGRAVAGTGIGSGGSYLTQDEIQSTVIFALTAVYLLWQMALLIPKSVREYREWKKSKLKS